MRTLVSYLLEGLTIIASYFAASNGERRHFLKGHEVVPTSSFSLGSASHAIAGSYLGGQMRGKEILHHRTGGAISATGVRNSPPIPII